MNKKTLAPNDAKEWLLAYVRKKHTRASDPDGLGLDVPADAFPADDDVDALLDSLDLGPACDTSDDGRSDIIDDEAEGTPVEASGEKLTLADLKVWDEARRKQEKADYDHARYDNKVFKATGKHPRKNLKLSHMTPEEKAERKAQQKRDAAKRQRMKLKKITGASKA
jgi:hypothetical protein